MKKFLSMFLIFCFAGIFLVSCSQETMVQKAEMVTFTLSEEQVLLGGDTPILDTSFGTANLTTAGELCDSESSKCFSALSLVKLSGRIQHFGYDITQNPPTQFEYFKNVPDVKIWIAEYPFTRNLNITSGADGIWTIWVLKLAGQDLDFSYIYEKEGWITTKSNVITVTDEDNTDIATQFIDPLYYNYGVKPAIEAQLSAAFGFPFVMQSGLVTTIGKSWASMHEEILPHGDPGATAIMTPAVPFPATVGPVYFNEQIEPDPTHPYTSEDGGVMWFNMPTGTFDITANKEGVEYETIRFVITEEDFANGVTLFIASPPDSVIGDNDSAPGEW